MSGRVTISYIQMRKTEAERALRFSYAHPENDPYFLKKLLGKTTLSVKAELKDCLEELDNVYGLNLIASVEGAIRTDVARRLDRRLKDNVSRQFQSLARRTGSARQRIPFDDILDVWREWSDQPRTLSELKRAMSYRHWIAHGRYWNFTPDRRHDFSGLVLLAETLLTHLPLLS